MLGRDTISCLMRGRRSRLTGSGCMVSWTAFRKKYSKLQFCITKVLLNPSQKKHWLMKIQRGLEKYWMHSLKMVDSVESIVKCWTFPVSKVLNPVNFAPGDEQHITVADLKMLPTNDTINDWNGEPDRKFFLSYDFNPVNSWHFHDPEHYPIFGGKFS